MENQVMIVCSVPEEIFMGNVGLVMETLLDSVLEARIQNEMVHLEEDAARDFEALSKICNEQG